MKVTQKPYVNKQNPLRVSSNSLNRTYNYGISNVYIQSKNLSLFSGVSDEIECGGNSTFERAYFLISNPKNSKVNIYVQNSIISNISSYPIISKIYYCVEDIVCPLDFSNNISILNSSSCGIFPKGKILFGNDIDKVYGNYAKNIIVSSYNSFNTYENGSVIISPGYSYLFEISPLDKNKLSSIIMSFLWWEEDIFI